MTIHHAIETYNMIIMSSTARDDKVVTMTNFVITDSVFRLNVPTASAIL